MQKEMACTKAKLILTLPSSASLVEFLVHPPSFSQSVLRVLCDINLIQ